ncbi:phage tail protein [Paenibacillus sp. UMB4589-SE434]|uniref:phage tail protein n=1 Tax=Paenibacillus sp. UMB4589-SE434 TaxID=3046314 RepID=UPI00254DC5B3|nr:phage tail protein [Paenibacillus sp. UMB4589-SE434]MDK8182124.1 phage tail protein [Paenibacillus sp. UMB4589-SE434]
MNYLQSYDKNLRRVGILNEVDPNSIQRRRRLNSDYELSFLVPMTSDDFREKIQLKGHVKDERGQYYIINSRQRVRDGRKLTAAITCTHVMFKLTDYKIPYGSYISEAFGCHISRLLDTISAATGGKYTFSIDNTFDLFDVKDWGRGNALQALNDVVKMYGCELEPDNFRIHVRKKIGADNGLQYRIGKNIVSTNFKDDANSLVTRMFAQMKDGRTWIGQPASILADDERSLLSQVPGAIVDGKLAVNYLISPYQAAWSNDTNAYFDGEIIEQSIEDPLKLLEAARKALREQEMPALEIAVSAADLFKLDRTEPRPQLGDTVRCIDPELGLNNITARITDLTEYPYAKDKHSQVTVTNVMMRDYEDIIADLEKSKRVVDNIFSAGKIRTDVFEAFAKQAITDINNSKTELVYPAEGGILARDKNNPLRQVRLTATGIGVSTDGWQSVRAAITADGIMGERIIGQIGNFDSLSVGSGNNIILLNRTAGLSAGNADFNSAPFRVDFQGNVVARSIKLTGQIDNSDLYSSRINAGTITGSLITGAQIIGGSIKSDTDIDVTRDVRVGNNIILGGTNELVAKSVDFAGAGAVYSDYLMRRVIVYGQNGVSLMGGSSGVYIGYPEEVNRVVTVGFLQNKLNEMWNVINAKSDKTHTHTVSIPNHNHGNPQNQNSGGGVFTVS